LGATSIYASGDVRVTDDPDPKIVEPTDALPDGPAPGPHRPGPRVGGRRAAINAREALKVMIKP
jgi:hypothetical protein